jgi:hypothetical protein
MNTLLVITLTIALPVYALRWHNQPAHPQTGKTAATKDPATFPFAVFRLTRFAATAGHWVASCIPTKWQTIKIHVHSPTQFNRIP